VLSLVTVSFAKFLGPHLLFLFLGHFDLALDRSPLKLHRFLLLVFHLFPETEIE